jgi:hypothetical protein
MSQQQAAQRRHVRSGPGSARSRAGQCTANRGPQVLAGPRDRLIRVPALELDIEAAELRVHPQRMPGIVRFESAAHARDRLIEGALFG